MLAHLLPKIRTGVLVENQPAHIAFADSEKWVEIGRGPFSPYRFRISISPALNGVIRCSRAVSFTHFSKAVLKRVIFKYFDAVSITESTAVGFTWKQLGFVP